MKNITLAIDEATLAALAAYCDAIITCFAQVTPAVIDACSRCQIISRYGIVATEHPLASQIGAAILAQGGNAIDAAVAAVFGLIYGGIMPLYAVIAREYFPMRIMGTVIGASTVFSAGGMALGPAVGGWIYDTTGSYTVVWWIAVALGVFAALINGAASHFVEQDDLHNSSVLHPATVVFPAVLAAAQETGFPPKVLP